MKKVQFNVTYNYNNISDEQYTKRAIKYKNLSEDDHIKYGHTLNNSGYEFPIIYVQKGDIKDIPNWMYEKLKDDTTTVSISLENIPAYNKNGRLMPFSLEEALDHGHLKCIENASAGVHKINTITLIEDLDIQSKKKVD